MKHLEKLPLMALFGATLAAGCASTASQTATSPADSTATEVAAVPTVAAAPTEVPAAPTQTPTKNYRVTEPEELAALGAPDGLVAALKKVKVAPPALSTKVPEKARVELRTTKGPVVVELNGKAAPMHVRSFLHLVGRNFYNGTVFHRHADLSGDGKGYIIQGGDPLSKDSKNKDFFGQGGPGYEVPLEADNGLKHEKLVIAAARSQDPDSAGSQFYITQGATPFLDEQYTVFGKVVSGQSNALKLVQGDKLQGAKVVKTN